MKDRLTLILFLALALGGGLAIGYATAPGAWYAQLEKPAFTPPGWVFAPAWTALYILIAVAGWRVWRRARETALMRLWWGQLGLNFLWSPVFFAAQQVALALIIILLLLGTIGVFMILAWRRDRASAWLFAPYAAWVAFATVLNASIMVLN